MDGFVGAELGAAAGIGAGTVGVEVNGAVWECVAGGCAATVAVTSPGVAPGTMDGEGRERGDDAVAKSEGSAPRAA